MSEVRRPRPSAPKPWASTSLPSSAAGFRGFVPSAPGVELTHLLVAAFPCNRESPGSGRLSICPMSHSSCPQAAAGLGLSLGPLWLVLCSDGRQSPRLPSVKGAMETTPKPPTSFLEARVPD